MKLKESIKDLMKLQLQNFQKYYTIIEMNIEYWFGGVKVKILLRGVVN